jgi:hypothetical protein
MSGRGSPVTWGVALRVTGGVWPFFGLGAASRGDRTILAWHEVSGKVSPRDPSRRVLCDQRYRDGQGPMRVCTHRAEPLHIGPMDPIGPMGRDSGPSSGPTTFH